MGSDFYMTPAPSQVQHTPVGTLVRAAAVGSSQNAPGAWVSWMPVVSLQENTVPPATPGHSGQSSQASSSQHADTAFTPASDYLPTTFAIHTSRLKDYAATDDQTMESDQQVEELLSERDYEVFRQAAQQFKGSFHLSAEDQEELDLEAGTLILSIDPTPEEIMWKMQLSVTAALRHCARVRMSDESVEMPLFVIHHLHRRPSLNSSHLRVCLARSITDWRWMRQLSVSQHHLHKDGPQWVDQYTVSAQTLLHTEELRRWAAIQRSVMDSLVAFLLEHIPMDQCTKIVQEQAKMMSKAS